MVDYDAFDENHDDVEIEDITVKILMDARRDQ